MSIYIIFVLLRSPYYYWNSVLYRFLVWRIVLSYMYFSINIAVLYRLSPLYSEFSHTSTFLIIQSSRLKRGLLITIAFPPSRYFQLRSFDFLPCFLLPCPFHSEFSFVTLKRWKIHRGVYPQFERLYTVRRFFSV